MRVLYLLGYRLNLVPFDNLTAGGSLMLGQYQERPWDFDRTRSFSGEISQVGIWDEILTPEQIENLATCKSNEQVRKTFKLLYWSLLKGCKLLYIHRVTKSIGTCTTGTSPAQSKSGRKS